jgi:hypothetical protein
MPKLLVTRNACSELNRTGRNILDYGDYNYKLGLFGRDGGI